LRSCRLIPAAAWPATAAGRRADEQPSADGSKREQGDDQAGGEPHPAAEHSADARRRLVLLDDLRLAIVAPFDHGRVVGIDQAGLGVQVLHQLIVGLSVGDAPVHPDVRNQRVNRHRILLNRLITGSSRFGQPAIMTLHRRLGAPFSR
jgi:hypothetical protein